MWDAIQLPTMASRTVGGVEQSIAARNEVRSVQEPHGPARFFFQCCALSYALSLHRIVAPGKVVLPSIPERSGQRWLDARDGAPLVIPRRTLGTGGGATLPERGRSPFVVQIGCYGSFSPTLCCRQFRPGFASPASCSMNAGSLSSELEGGR